MSAHSGEVQQTPLRRWVSEDCSINALIADELDNSPKRRIHTLRILLPLITIGLNTIAALLNLGAAAWVGVILFNANVTRYFR